MTKLNVDIVIIGGGIAGLWTLNRLIAKGYNAVLIEATALGGGQTIKSQGIIHGGLKYALTGALNESSDAISHMPAIWSDCLNGMGELNLKAARILSDKQYLFSDNKMTNKIAGFFASKLLRGRVEHLAHKDFPSVLQNEQFNGSVYALHEMVMDVPALLSALSSTVQDRLLKADPSQMQFIKNHQGDIDCIQLLADDGQLELHASRFIFTAGAGNAGLLDGMERPKMQLRPLQMVLIDMSDVEPLYAHLTTTEMNPRLTITTHVTSKGKRIWYVGGELAETGVDRTQEEQIAATREWMGKIFPWIDFSTRAIKTFIVNRAEPAQAQGKRPSKPSITTVGNALIAWPVKLAFAPKLAGDVLAAVSDIQPSGSQTALPKWPKPSVATPPWEEMF